MANFKRFEIGNVVFDCITNKQVLGMVSDAVSNGERGRVISTVNMDILRQAKNDLELRHILNESWIVTADGMPIVWFSKIQTDSLPERVTGADLSYSLCENSAKCGFKLFFLGAAPGVGEKAKRRMENEFCDVNIVEVYSPTDIEINDDKLSGNIIQMINSSGANILLVALGAPKQEKWIYRNKHRLNVCVIIGVGASIDFLSGNIKRAPRIIRRMGLEWAFRLFLEPRRLWKRYAKDLIMAFVVLPQVTHGFLRSLGLRRRAKRN